MAGVTVNEGTQTNIASDTVGTQQYQWVKLDVGAAGASAPFANTLGTLQNLNKGTITRLEGGTLGALAVGTITTGTVDSISQLPPNSWGTATNAAGTAFGTIKPAIAGSSIYITDLIISMAVVPGTIALYNGANSNLLIGSLAFNAGGGIVTNFRTPVQGLSGSALCYQQQGTASIGVIAQGFVR